MYVLCGWCAYCAYCAYCACMVCVLCMYGVRIVLSIVRIVHVKWCVWCVWCAYCVRGDNRGKLPLDHVVELHKQGATRPKQGGELENKKIFSDQT